jgi:hypothetical protein
MIKTTTVDSTIGTNYLFYNKDGANSKENNRDQIYIDCQPVNEEGELLINESSGEAKTTGSDNDDALEKIKPFIYILIGIVAAMGITKGVSYLFKKMKKE